MAIWNLHRLVLDPLILVFLWFRVGGHLAVACAHLLRFVVSAFRSGGPLRDRIATRWAGGRGGVARAWPAGGDFFLCSTARDLSELIIIG